MGLRQLLPIIILREGVISRRLNITLVICRASSKLEQGKMSQLTSYLTTSPYMLAGVFHLEKVNHACHLGVYEHAMTLDL